MPKKSPPSPKYPKWTTSRYFQFIRSMLRRGWSRYPPKFDALNKVKKKVVGKRHKFEYRCSSCKQWFKRSEVEVHHLVDAGPLNSYDDLPGFVERLFTSEDMLSVECVSCHREITKRMKDEKRTS